MFYIKKSGRLLTSDFSSLVTPLQHLITCHAPTLVVAMSGLDPTTILSPTVSNSNFTVRPDSYLYEILAGKCMVEMLIGSGINPDRRVERR